MFRSYYLPLMFCLGALAHADAAQNSVVVWGDPTITNVPVSVTNVAGVSGGAYRFVAWKRDGTVVFWPSQASVPSFTNVASAAMALNSSWAVLLRDGTAIQGTGTFITSNAVSIAAEAYGFCTLRKDGVLVQSGPGPAGSSGSNVVAITGGAYSTAEMLFSDGHVSTINHRSPQVASISNAVTVASPRRCAVWLLSDGRVVSDPQAAPNTLTTVVAISAGVEHGLALKQDGTVVSWGSNTFGQTQVPPGLTGVVAISAGAYHNLALRSDGTVVAWGDNRYGQTNVPTTLTNVAAILAGNQCSLAIVGGTPPTFLSQPPDEVVIGRSAATFSPNVIGSPPLDYQWQFNGEVIPGATKAFYRIDQTTPAHSGVYNLVVRNPHGAVISRDSVLKVIGNPGILAEPKSQINIFGSTVQLSVTSESPSPVSYQWYFSGRGLYGATLANLTINHLSDRTAGDYWCVVRNLSGSVTSAVAQINVYLPLGSSNLVTWLGGVTSFFTSTAETVPVTYQWFHDGQELTGITSSKLDLLNLRIEDAGDYQVIAKSVYGSATSSVARLSVLAIATWVNQSWVTGYAVPTNLTRVSGFACGYDHALAIQPDGHVLGFGYNYDGAATIPPGLSNVVAVSGGYAHSLALLEDGTVRSWGDQTNVPPGLSNIVAIAAGLDGSIALGADGLVRAWGDPLIVDTLPAGLNDVVSISLFLQHCLALRRDGTLVSWGDNSYGQTNVPAELSNAVAVAVGERHSLVVRRDGTVVAWGDNTFSQLNIPNGLSNVIAVTAGSYHSLALKSDGTVVAWGYSSSGVTGVPPGLSNVVAISCMGFQSFAVVAPGLDAPAVEILSVGRTAGNFSVMLPTRRGKSYYMQSRDLLPSRYWSLTTPAPGDGTLKAVVDPTATTSERFYRVWQKP